MSYCAETKYYSDCLLAENTESLLNKKKKKATKARLDRALSNLIHCKNQSSLADSGLEILLTVITPCKSGPNFTGRGHSFSFFFF